MSCPFSQIPEEVGLLSSEKYVPLPDITPSLNYPIYLLPSSKKK
jgi:hypothetical protein